jgi:transposase InsO family protein
LLGIDRQVYYRAVKSKQKSIQVASCVVAMIKAVRLRMPRIGGKKLYKILHMDLKKLKIGRDKLFAIMKANHLQITPKRRYHITTNSHHRFKKHKNLIENLRIYKPEQVYVSDITYIGTRTYPMYLALVTDTYSKKIMGFNVSNSLSTAGALSALKMAIKNRIYKHADLIHHSDKGLQYCSNEYQEMLIKNKIICSMTEKYDPYQNAVAERVNGILKQEFLDGIRVNDIQLMHLLVSESIDIYNNERPHYSNYYQTPQQMHLQSNIKMRTYKKKIASLHCDAIK